MKFYLRILAGFGFACLGAALAVAEPEYAFACGWISACIFVLLTGQWRNVL